MVLVGGRWTRPQIELGRDWHTQGVQEVSLSILKITPFKCRLVETLRSTLDKIGGVVQWCFFTARNLKSGVARLTTRSM